MLPEFSLVNADGKKLPWNNHEISASILAESNGKIKLETQIPIISITSVWHPGQFSIPPVKLPWFLGNKCGANTSLPLLVFLDQNYSVRYAVGLTNGIDDTEFTCKMNQELCCFEVSFTISVCKETEPFEIFFDNSGGSLKTVLQKYRGKIIPEIPDYPSAAWEPVYCTWYAVHAALTKEYLKSNAQEAADLGFGTFIVDDGWCYKESKRVTPATLPDWYQDIGDWKYSEEKLPGLKNIVEHAQKLGLNYMFWVAPFFSGKRSELNGKISSFVTELHEGQRVYDPADEAADAITEKSIFEIFRLMVAAIYSAG